MWPDLRVNTDRLKTKPPRTSLVLREVTIPVYCPPLCMFSFVITPKAAQIGGHWPRGERIYRSNIHVLIFNGVTITFQQPFHSQLSHSLAFPKSGAWKDINWRLFGEYTKQMIWRNIISRLQAEAWWTTGDTLEPSYSLLLLSIQQHWPQMKEQKNVPLTPEQHSARWSGPRCDLKPKGERTQVASQKF